MQDLNLNLFIYLFSLNYFIIAQNLAKISYGNELQVSTQNNITKLGKKKKKRKSGTEIQHFDFLVDCCAERERMCKEAAGFISQFPDQHVMARREICLALAASLEAQFRLGGLKHKDTTNQLLTEVLPMISQSEFQLQFSDSSCRIWWQWSKSCMEIIGMQIVFKSHHMRAICMIHS